MTYAPQVPATARRRWYRRPVTWIAAGVAVLVLIGVAAVVLLNRDPYREVSFASVVTEVNRIPTGAKSISYAFTAVDENQAYLGYQQTDGLHLIGYDLAQRKQQWTTTIKAPDSSASWDGILALPDGGLLIEAHGFTGDRPYTVFGVDSSGRQRWNSAFGAAGDIWVTGPAVVIVDKLGKRLVGLDPHSGDRKWALPDIKDEYGTSTVAIYPVFTEAEFAGPAGFNGLRAGPISDGRIVQLSADSSARVIDTATGSVTRTRGNIGDPRQATALAYAGRLYLAAEASKYQLLSYDLDTLGAGKLVYAAPDANHRLKALAACGSAVCLLDETNFDDKTAQVLAVDPGAASVTWHRPAHDADVLTPLGAGLMVQNTNSSSRYTQIFGGDGAVLLGDAGKDQTGVRLTGGSVLLFSKVPQRYADDQSLYGFTLGSHTRTPLGDIKNIRSADCSWNTQLLVCPSDTDFGVWRFAS
jgi:hypothetical protein